MSRKRRIVADEIEKGRELEKADPFGVGFISFGESVQKSEDVFRGDMVDGSITEFFDIPLDDGPVGSHRIFYSNGSCGSRFKILAARDNFMAFLLGLKGRLLG